MKSDHIWKKTRKIIQPTKKVDCLVKLAVKKIFLSSKYKVLIDTRNNREKMKKTLKGDILKFSESDRSIDDLKKLLYLVIFPHEKGYRFNYTDYIRLQIREVCKKTKYVECKIAYFLKESRFGGLRAKAAQINKFIPSRKKIRNLILSARNETRHSKID